jgi:hypothetical protein
MNVEDEADRNLHNAAFEWEGFVRALIIRVLPTCQQQIKRQSGRIINSSHALPLYYFSSSHSRHARNVRKSVSDIRSNSIYLFGLCLPGDFSSSLPGTIAIQ